MEKEIKETLDKINNGLASLALPKEPFNLYDPIKYILQIGGKRVRPMLAILAYQLYKKDTDKVIFPILALEVFHNFTLVHDDIMDKAPLRRGNKTVHTKWNSNIAILSGDVMLVKAYELLSHAPKEVLPTLLSKFNTCAQEVCEGQQKDMDFENRPSVTVEEYLDMIRQKTAVLLGFSLEMGAILGGAPKGESDRLYQVGVNLGLAFQLQDDLLDLYGGASFGKQVGGDVINKKKSILITKALELSPNKNELLELYNSSIENRPDKVGEVNSKFDNLNIDEEVNEMITRFENTVYDHLNNLKCTFSKNWMIDFFNKLQERKS